MKGRETIVQIAAREIPIRCEENKFHNESSQALEQIFQRDYGNSVLGDIKKLMSSKLAMVWWWGGDAGNQVTSSGPFQPELIL